MTGFLVIAVVLTLAVSGLLAIPLLRNRSGPAPVAAVLTVLLVPVLTLTLYLTSSNYDWTSPPTVMKSQRSSQTMAPSLDQAISQLEAKLREQPDNLEGWLLLGNAYLQTRRFEDAQTAFSTALRLSNGKDPKAKLGLAEAMILLDQSSVNGQAGELVEDALQELPNNPKALWYGGLAALARQDIPAVQQRWEHLLQLNPPDAVRRVVVEQLTAAGITPPEIAPAQPTAAGSSPQIRVTVNIAEQLAQRIGQGAVLFLAARDGDRPGPPIAAVRAPASGFPRRLMISDANVMMPGRSLADADEVRLVARVSASGTAIAQPGDIYGEARWHAGDGPVTIMINKVVQSR